MDREYVIVKSPPLFPRDSEVLRQLDSGFWQSYIFYHFLKFYKDHNIEELKIKIKIESEKPISNIEKLIAKYIRKYLRSNRDFNLHFDVNGESETDTDIVGFYDIKISNTYWRENDKKKYFPFECKNLTLDSKKNHIAEYVFVNYKKDGGVYRYFNGKYAQKQNFGGMLGFVLEGEVDIIKDKIIERLKLPFETTPQGDLIADGILLNSIEDNNFTFNSIHKRFDGDFTLHHMLFDFK